MTNQNTDDRAVEAVARAICEDLHGAPDDYDDLAWRNQAIKTARAAISAYRQHLEAEGMVVVPREPSGAMIENGSNHHPGINYRGDWQGDTSRIYRAMIQAHEEK